MKFQIQAVCGKFILIGCVIANIYHPCIYKSYAFYNIHFKTFRLFLYLVGARMRLQAG